MIRLLPFIIIPVLLVALLGWWRYSASTKNLPSGAEVSENSEIIEPVEVPKTLPNATLEERVGVLEETLIKLINSVNAMKAQTPSKSSQTQSPTSTSTSSSADAAITELKARVAALEKASPVPVVSSGKSTIYIPLGSGGGPWANTDWYSTPEYEISLDPANYPGYTGMVLEVTFRMVESAGTASVRLYNVSSGSATSGQVDTTSTSYELKSTSSFTLPSGTKTYKLQVKSTGGKDLFIQSARIKVSF